MLKHHGWRVRSVHLPVLPVDPRRFVGPLAGRGRDPWLDCWRARLADSQLIEGAPHVPLRRRHRPGNDQHARWPIARPASRPCDRLATSPIETLPIPQVVGVNDVSRTAAAAVVPLPAGPKEFPAGALDLPWKSPPDRVVGVSPATTGPRCPAGWSARPRAGCRTPASIAGARSCPGRRPRTWPRSRRSTASAAYLEHLREAWNARIAGKTADDRLENQEVMPDGAGLVRRRGPRADRRGRRPAGLEHVTLLEEPQAAFYAWLAARARSWRKQVEVGDIVLVCDVGGGTTDFTLIAVSEEAGDLVLTRLAVGEHILLGGDNMDLALAHAVAATLPQGMDGSTPAQCVALGTPAAPPRRRCSPTRRRPRRR